MINLQAFRVSPVRVATVRDVILKFLIAIPLLYYGGDGTGSGKQPKL